MRRVERKTIVEDSTEAGSCESRALWLLSAPCAGLLILVLSVVLARLSGALVEPWRLLEFSAGAYWDWLAVLLLVERFLWPPSASDARGVEVLVATIGLLASACFLWRSMCASDLRWATFGGVSSAAFLFPRRTDLVRAIAFGVMAAATAHRPLIALCPPYISAACFAVAASAACLAGVIGRAIAGIPLRRYPGRILGQRLHEVEQVGVARASKVASKS